MIFSLGSWRSWKSPMKRNSKLDDLYLNFIAGIGTSRGLAMPLQDPDEENANDRPIGLTQKVRQIN